MQRLKSGSRQVVIEPPQTRYLVPNVPINAQSCLCEVSPSSDRRDNINMQRLSQEPSQNRFRRDGQRPFMRAQSVHTCNAGPGLCNVSAVSRNACINMQRLKPVSGQTGSDSPVKALFCTPFGMRVQSPYMCMHDHVCATCL